MKFPFRFAFLLRMGFVLLLSLGLWARVTDTGSTESTSSHRTSTHHVGHRAVHKSTVRGTRKVASRRRSKSVRHTRAHHAVTSRHSSRRSHRHTAATHRTRRTRRHTRHVSVGQ